jgi:hypothetical protein
MTPQERLRKALELSQFSRTLVVAGLRRLHPDASAEEFQRVLLERLERCHNRNF